MIRRILELAFVIAAAWAALGGLIYLAVASLEQPSRPAAKVVEVKKRGE